MHSIEKATWFEKKGHTTGTLREVLRYLLFLRKVSFCHSRVSLQLLNRLLKRLKRNNNI